MTPQPSKEMPKYKSHKTVWALKIKDIIPDGDLSDSESDGSAIIVPEESDYGYFKVDAAYMNKHKPKSGGYFVVYEDGYKSWSPADVFEKGNILITEQTTKEPMSFEWMKSWLLAYDRTHEGGKGIEIFNWIVSQPMSQG